MKEGDIVEIKQLVFLQDAQWHGAIVQRVEGEKALVEFIKHDSMGFTQVLWIHERDKGNTWR